MQTEKGAALSRMGDGVVDVERVLPAELVRRVTDEVYRLLLRDLRLEHERRGNRHDLLHNGELGCRK